LLWVDPGDPINDDSDPSVGELAIWIDYRASGDQTGHHMRKRSTDDEAFFLPDVGNLNLGHQLFRQDRSGSPHTTASNHHKLLITIHILFLQGLYDSEILINGC